MKRIAFVVVAMMLPFSFSACGSEEPNSPNVGGGSEVEHSTVYPVTVDGTRCVVVDNYNGSGISCDFN